jgi:hypothetical protein
MRICLAESACLALLQGNWCVVAFSTPISMRAIRMATIRDRRTKAADVKSLAVNRSIGKDSYPENLCVLTLQTRALCDEGNGSWSIS